MSEVRRVELRSPAEVEALLERLEVAEDSELAGAIADYWSDVERLWRSHEQVMVLVRELNAGGRLSEYRAERVTGWARSTVRGVLGKPKKGVV